MGVRKITVRAQEDGYNLARQDSVRSADVSCESDNELEGQETPAPLPPWRRYVGLTFCLVECLLFGGTIYGWYSLVYIFKQDGIYSDLCEPTGGNSSTPTPINVTTSREDTRQGGCGAQAEQLQLAFTIALAVQGVASLLFGIFFDRFGLLPTRIIASVAAITGYLLLAFTDIDRPWMIFPGSAFVAVSCVSIILTNSHAASLAGSVTALVITLNNGAVNTSGAVFFVIKLVHEAGIPRVYSLPFLCCLWSIVLISTIFILPHYKVPSFEDPQPNRVIDISSATTGDNEGVFVINGDSENITQEKEKPLRKYIFSSLNIIFLFWFAALHVCIMFYLGSFNTRITDILNGDTIQVSYFTNMLAYAQMCAIFIAPLSGALMIWRRRSMLREGLTGQSRSIATILSILLACTASIILMVTSLIGSETLLYVSVFTSEVFRSTLYATAIAFLEITWPGSAFGALFGMAYLVAGVAALMQFPYTIWIQRSGFFTVDWFLLGTCLAALILPVTIAVRYYVAKSKAGKKVGIKT